jgi:DNA-directed RNA polymerase subunit M/transcription elongation factor TFIIS
MNKAEMKKILKAPFSEIIKIIKSKDVNKELEALNDLQSTCEDLKYLAEKRKQTITKGKLKCKECGYCFKPNPKKQYVIKHIVNKPTYWDSGYGEDDRYADFEVTDIYENCPKCQAPIAVKLAWYEEQIPGTEKDRWGNRYD